MVKIIFALILMIVKCPFIIVGFFFRLLILNPFNKGIEICDDIEDNLSNLSK